MWADTMAVRVEGLFKVQLTRKVPERRNLNKIHFLLRPKGKPRQVCLAVQPFLFM